MRIWRKTQIDGVRTNSDREIWAQTDKGTEVRPEMGTSRRREVEARETLLSLTAKCKSFCCT